MDDEKKQRKMEAFSVLRGKVQNLLEHDEYSISNQISNMVWENACYQFVRESRVIGSEAELDLSSQNLLICDMLDRGYVASQSLSIRRLLDKGGDAISLTRILKIMSDRRFEITRENYVCIDDVPYEYELEEAAFHEKISGKGGFVGSGAKWADSRRRHRVFDQWSCRDEGNRSPKDLICLGKLKFLEEALKKPEFKNIHAYVDHYIAHAQEEKRRSRLQKNAQNLSFSAVLEVHKLLISILDELSAFWSVPSLVSALPQVQFDVTWGMDKPWLPEANFDQLRDYWSAYAADIEGVRPIFSNPLPSNEIDIFQLRAPN